MNHWRTYLIAVICGVSILLFLAAVVTELVFLAHGKSDLRPLETTWRYTMKIGGRLVECAHTVDHVNNTNSTSC